MSLWFIQSNLTVTGPFSLDEVETSIEKNSDVVIWGKGLNIWLNPSEWRQHISTQAKLAENLSSINWQFKNLNFESSLMTLENLVQEISNLKNIENILVKSENQSNWESVFTNPIIADNLGISRRKMIRVPIFGFFEGICGPKNQLIKAKITTLSEQGCGLTDVSGLGIGNQIKGIILSPNLALSFHISGTVVYARKDGETGIKFDHLTPEVISVVSEYIRKFQASNIK